MMKVIKYKGHIIRYGITDDNREMFFANVDYTDHNGDLMQAAGVGEDFLEMCGKKRNGDMNYIVTNVLYALGYNMDGTPDKNAMPLKYAKLILTLSENEIATMRDEMKNMNSDERLEYVNNLIPRLRNIWGEKAKAVISKYNI